MTPKPNSKPPMSEFVLELQRLSVRDLVARYHDVFGKAPRNRNHAFLWRRIAHEEQMRRYGGLSVAAKRRLAELMKEIELPDPPARSTSRRRPRAGEPPVGTRLERQWRGRTRVAIRVEGGWAVDGVVHGSLSAAAKAVTGAHRSGRAFFGLSPERAR
mgnify:CR=1 FL=1